LELHKKIVLHNQTVNSAVDTSFVLDSSLLLPLEFPDYLLRIKVLIKITEFDLGWKRVKASYVSDYYYSDFTRYKGLKYGTTYKDLSTTQTAENGTQTSSYTDKLQGLQIQGNVITITANNRDLEVSLYGGSQELLQVRKQCVLNIFGFEAFCGLVQTEIFVSLE
jgi:hypothetical protein